jgi:hypothetical protein
VGKVLTVELMVLGLRVLPVVLFSGRCGVIDSVLGCCELAREALRRLAADVHQVINVSILLQVLARRMAANVRLALL